MGTWKMPTRVIEDLNDFKSFAGREIGMTDWLVVTQERIQQFAEATEDRQWIHVDPERAKRESPYRTTIAHGFLTLSLLSFLMKQAIQIKSGVRMAVNYGLNRVRFPSPVRADSKIRGRFTLLTLKEVSNAFEAVFSVSVESEGADKPCCVAEWIIRYYR
jgi:acyl dehydratase